MPIQTIHANRGIVHFRCMLERPITHFIEAQGSVAIGTLGQELDAPSAMVRGLLMLLAAFLVKPS